MDREKQIEEITKVIARRSMAFRNPNVAFMTTARKTANSLYNAGYRNQSEVAKEIIGEILLNHTPDIDGFFTIHESELAKIKNKYTEE